MADQFEFSDLMNRRKLTTAVAEILKDQLNLYLDTFAPLLAPRAVLGDHTRGSSIKIKGADETFAAVKETYLKVAGSRIFDLPKTLESPIGISSAQPEIAPLRYQYEAVVDGTSKQLTITSPTKWVLSYKGLNEARLKSLLAQHSDLVGQDLAELIVHFVVMDAVVQRQRGVVDMLSELGYSVAVEEVPDYDNLPIVYISSQVGTERPSDELLVQVSEVSGSPSFDELVRVSDINNMSMPLKTRLMEQLREHDAG